MAIDSGRALGELARDAGDLLVAVHGGRDVRISGMAFDSGAVARGDLFFCIPGKVTDGHLYAEAAVTAGAVALCVGRLVDVDVAQVEVADVRRAMPRLAAA